MRLLAIMLALLALAPAAYAQDVEDPGDEPVVEETPVADETPVAVDDDYYALPCGEDYYDLPGGDYYYCVPQREDAGGDGAPVNKNPPAAPTPTPSATSVPIQTPLAPEPQAVAAATLPVTGGSPVVVGLIGVSMLLTGAGGRVLTARR